MKNAILGIPAVALAATLGLWAHTARAAGVVASCTEAALDAALVGGGNVTFNCGASPVTITVTSTKTVSVDTTIDGGSLITISGGHSVGVFSVNTGITFTVQNLTIANGSTDGGGGIFNSGTLTVTSSTFTGNSSVGDFGGGGIFNYYPGTVTVTNSTFAANSSVGDFGGGGIFNYYSTLTVTNSTFAGNSASGATGGGIANVGGTVHVTNSTVANNSAATGGGIVNDTGMLTVTNSTFAGNSAADGGGIVNVQGTVTVTNTIIAQNPGGNCDGDPITDGGHNLEDADICGFAGAGCATPGGTSFCNTAPGLAAALTDNGGRTQTIALQAGSPAINTGDEAICAAAPVNNLDQRGYVRPGTGATKCSIGAYEYNAAPACIGDCDATDSVSVDKIITLVNISLDLALPEACSEGNPTGGPIGTEDLIAALNNLLLGCPTE